MTLWSKLNQPPLRLLIFVWLYIFGTGRICVFWREHIKILNVGTFTLEIKNKNKNFMPIVPFDRRNMIKVLKCIVLTPANSHVLF